ncbi:MAG: ArnT family glycosyltransferase [Acidobacteriota bacterium]
MKPGSYLFLFLLALPFFVALDESALWDSNEAFYAQTPREMVERGEWVVPYFNGEPRLNKPPLSYWIVAAFYKLFSISIFWERLPMAALAYGSVLVLFRIGKLLFDEQAALWGAGIFATTFRFLILARRYFIEILLLFCILAVIACFLAWLKRGRKGDFLLCSLFLGLAFLAKGPVILIAPGFLGLYLALTGRLKILRRAPWLAGFLIFGAVSSFWFVLLGVQAGWQPVADFFLVENLGRFTSVDFGPRRGSFYYAGALLGDFFPWSFLFLAALVWWFRRERPAEKAAQDPVLLLLIWIGAYILVFSLSFNKQEHYILPVYPAASLLVALYLCKARPASWLLALAGASSAAAAVLFFLISRQLFPEEAGLWVLPLLAAFLPVFLLGRRFGASILLLALLYFAAFNLYLEPMRQYQPVPYFADTIRDRSAHDEACRAGYYRYAAPSLSFYLNRPILALERQEQAVEALNSETPVFLIVPAEDFPALQEAVSKPLEIIESRPKLNTTARTLISALQRGQTGPVEWARLLYLITNQKTSTETESRF